MVETILQYLGLNLEQLLLLLVPLLPLMTGLLARLLAGQRHVLACGLGIASLLASAGLGLQLLLTGQTVECSADWVSLGGGLTIPLALSISPAQLLFILTTALLAALVLVYALRERRNDPRAGLFHAHLTLFAGSMLLLLCADTLLLVYLAWELLGLFSFLLIAHSGTAEAKRSARQAFWTTRATDMGLLLGCIMLMAGFGWTRLGGIDIAGLQGLPPERQLAALGLLGLAGGFFLLAVLGKAAQWPLSFWLADAMAAPVPASALLHGATLVAAGPYLLFRLAELYQTLPFALGLLAFTGALSCVLCGLMALFATDAKRLLAYSTASQLGLCIAGYGLLAEWPAYAQLLAHAWAKAGLFLAVGIALAAWHSAQAGHAADGQPRLEQLSGILRGRWLLLAALLLGGLPLLWSAGKDAVLLAALGRSGEMWPGSAVSFAEMLPAAQWGWQAAAVLLILGGILSAAYLTRLILVLAGPSTVAASYSSPENGGLETAATETGMETTAAGAGSQHSWAAAQAAVLACALLAVAAMALPFTQWGAVLLRPEARSWQWAEDKQGLGAGLSLLLITLGAGLGWLLTRPALSTRLAAQPLALYLANGMYLREFWLRVAAGGGLWLARLADRAETGVLQRAADGTGRLGRAFARSSAWLDRHLVDGLRWQACELWWRIRRLHRRWLQTGDIQHYMLVILLSAVVLCLVVVRPLSHIFAQMLARL